MLITTDDCDEGLIEIPLYGFGYGPEIDVNPASINFGTWSVSGGTSATQTVTVRNKGNRTLTFTSINITGPHLSDFALVSPSTGLTDPLPGFQSRALILQFDPSAEGARNAFLTLASNDCDEPTLHIPLIGAGLSPKKDERTFLQGNLTDGPSGVWSWSRYK